MSINFYTDSKSLETYNRIHLLFLTIFSVIYLVFIGSYSKLLITIVLTLGICLVVESIKVISIGPGDSKMIIVSSIFLLITTKLKMTFIILFSILIMKLYIVLITVTFVAVALLYYKVVKREKIGERSFRCYAYTVTINQMANRMLPTINLSVPATGGILLSTLTLLVIF